MSDEQKRKFCKLVIWALKFLVCNADRNGFGDELSKELAEFYNEL